MKQWFDTLSKFLFLYNFSIRSRLILYFLFLVLLPTTIISITIYNKSTEIIARNADTSIQNNLNLVEDHLMQKFNNADDAMISLYLNSEFADLISSDRATDGTGIINELNELNKILENFPSSGGTGVRFVPMLYMVNRPEYTQYNFSRRVFNSDLISLKPWYLNIPAKSDMSVIGLSSLDSQYTLKFAKRLFGIRHIQLPYVGILTLDIPLSDFNSTVENYKPTPGSKIYVVDQNDRIALSPDPELIGKSLSTLEYSRNMSTSETDDQFRSFQYKQDGENMLMTYKDITPYGWKVIALSPISELSGDLFSFRRVMYLVITVCMLLSLMMALLLSENISAPIRKFVHSMSHAETGNFNIKIVYKRKDEFAYLFQRYNAMMQQIKALIDKLYVTELRKKEAELKSLQAQINPHFLYNTLDSMNWLAIRHNVPELSNMVTSLADFFRYSLSKGNNVIPLRDELRQVESYLEIQRFRFQDKLEYQLEAADAELLNSCLIVKLTLQPLVENAIVHGIQKKQGPGMIRIRVRQESGNLLTISVFDNGAGADPRQLNDLLNARQPTDNSYGIRNVHSRIKQFFGEAYGIKYYRNDEDEQGLLVVVSCPMVTTWNEVNEDDHDDHRG